MEKRPARAFFAAGRFFMREAGWHFVALSLRFCAPYDKITAQRLFSFMARAIRLRSDGRFYHTVFCLWLNKDEII